MVQVDANDAELNAARAKAQATLSQFIWALQHPDPSRSHFAVKVLFTEVKPEYMWLNNATFDGTAFLGVLTNRPIYTRYVHAGQTISSVPHWVTDWQYVENGKLVGGYTTRIFRQRMSPQDRATFDKICGYKID